jgi:tRNA pseudouridine(38-40) synthase
MPTWRLDIEYEGTRYRGWQIQHNARTVQGEMAKAVRELFEAKARSSARVAPTRAFMPLGRSHIFGSLN